MVELVPARVRCSASGIAYNLCLGLFGGTAPWVATWLVARTADDLAPAWYMTAAALLALLAAWHMPEMGGTAARAMSRTEAEMEHDPCVAYARKSFVQRA